MKLNPREKEWLNEEVKKYNLHIKLSKRLAKKRFLEERLSLGKYYFEGYFPKDPIVLSSNETPETGDISYEAVTRPVSIEEASRIMGHFFGESTKIEFHRLGHFESIVTEGGEILRGEEEGLQFLENGSIENFLKNFKAVSPRKIYETCLHGFAGSKGYRAKSIRISIPYLAVKGETERFDLGGVSFFVPPSDLYHKEVIRDIVAMAHSRLFSPESLNTDPLSLVLPYQYRKKNTKPLNKKKYQDGQVLVLINGYDKPK